MHHSKTGVSEGRFRAFADHVRDAFYLHDEDGVILAVNQRACDMLGYTRDELIGLHPRDFDASDIDHLGAYIQSRHAQGKEARFDTYHRRKDGGLFPVEVRLFPYEEEGRVLRMALVSDISVRKKAEEVTKRLNRELHAISVCHQILLRAEDEKALLGDICQVICEEAGYRMAWVGYVEHDEAKSIRALASAGYDAGYTAESDISWSEDTDRGRGPVGVVVRSGATVQVQDTSNDPHIAPWRERALERGYRSSIGIPLKKEKAGEVFGVLSIYASEPNVFVPEEVHLLEELAEDLAFGINVLRMRTERDLAEESLRLNEERYRTIFLNSPLGLFRSTVQGEFVEANPALADMLGYASPGEMIHEISDIGRQIYVDPYMRQEVVTRQLRAPGNVMQYTNRYLRKDGRERIANLYLKTIRDHEGKPVFFDGIVEDITEKLESEEAQQRLESQLNQAQKMESVGRLAGGVAHDFNNMLAAIMGYSDLALKKTDSALPVHGYIQEIRKAADHSADLTRQLLTFARKQKVAPKVLNLNTTLERMLNILQRLIGEDIYLDWLAGEDLWPVRLDPGQIDQILANLCVNARDAIEGVGRITIRTQNRPLTEADCAEHPDIVSGDFVCLSVGDDGCGMSEDLLRNVFEPFFTTKGQGKGTGLGLSTVYGIVKQNAGAIKVESEPGNGTTFHIYLPRHVGTIDKTKQEMAGDQASRGHETILLVEDEPALLDIMQLMLKENGYRVLAASSPSKAMTLATAHAKTGKIDLLLTDVVMPDMNGYDLAQSLMLLYPGIRRVFISGYADNAILPREMQESSLDFIQKPFSMPSLLAQVRASLDGACGLHKQEGL